MFELFRGHSPGLTGPGPGRGLTGPGLSGPGPVPGKNFGLRFLNEIIR